MRIQIDHARNVRFGHHHVVQRLVVAYRYLAAEQVGFQQFSLPDAVLAS